MGGSRNLKEGVREMPLVAQDCLQPSPTQCQEGLPFQAQLRADKGPLGLGIK